MNGSLNVNIPLWSFAQRGKVKLDFRLGYDSTTYVEFRTCEYAGTDPFPDVSGLTLQPFDRKAHITPATRNYVLQEDTNIATPDAKAPP
jgi:hypothetical protein